MAKNSNIIQDEDIRITCDSCDIIAKVDDDGDVQIMSVIGSNMISQILIPSEALCELSKYLKYPNTYSK